MPTPSTIMTEDSTAMIVTDCLKNLPGAPNLREASDAIAVRRVNSDAAFRTTFSRVWRFTLFAFASVIFTWLKYACVSPILTQGRC